LKLLTFSLFENNSKKSELPKLVTRFGTTLFQIRYLNKNYSISVCVCQEKNWEKCAKTFARKVGGERPVDTPDKLGYSTVK